METLNNFEVTWTDPELELNFVATCNNCGGVISGGCSTEVESIATLAGMTENHTCEEANQ